MNILLTGASGLVGTALQAWLTGAGHRVVPLRRGGGPGQPSWDLAAGRIDLAPAGRLDAVIHLAGETVAQRWTSAVRARIRDSRVTGTRLLAEALARMPERPRVLVCASATGFYGSRGEEWVDEASPAGRGFLSDVAQVWEAAADPARAAGIRVVHARLGIVLSRRGGALAKMLPIFRLGLGGPVGNGRQFWSWIALDDVVAVLARALTEEAWRGPINVVSPGPVTSREFARVLGRVLRRPAFLPVPGLAVRAMFGEMGRETLLGGVRVRPGVLLESGFRFEHPELEGALRGELDPGSGR
ncbi:MAG: hypothetical protein RJA22_420 [Verrucomicrobiota bacterium]|jgi:uncharacterized protein (TIGR01777 family)